MKIGAGRTRAWRWRFWKTTCQQLSLGRRAICCDVPFLMPSLWYAQLLGVLVFGRALAFAEQEGLACQEDYTHNLVRFLFLPLNSAIYYRKYHQEAFKILLWKMPLLGRFPGFTLNSNFGDLGKPLKQYKARWLCILGQVHLVFLSLSFLLQNGDHNVHFSGL